MKLIIQTAEDREENEEKITELVQEELNNGKMKTVEFK